MRGMAGGGLSRGVLAVSPREAPALQPQRGWHTEEWEYRVGEADERWEKSVKGGRRLWRVGEVYEEWEKPMKGGRSLWKVGEAYEGWEKPVKGGRSLWRVGVAYEGWE